MTGYSLTRRELGLGLAAAGAALPLATAQGAAALSGGPAPRANPGIARGYQPCRFGQVHYRTVGPKGTTTKLPLLCMHASPGSSVTYLNILPALGAHRLVIAPDTPGYGLSDRTPAPPTIEDYAAAMADMVDAMGLKKIDVLGNHTSSATAVELACRRPDLVRRVVINSALMYTQEDRQRYRAKLPTMAPASLEAAADGMKETWARFRSFRADLSEENAWLLFIDMHRDPTRRAWGYAASFEYDFAAALRTMRQPILIMNSHDELYEITARAKGVAAKSRVVDLPWSSGTFTTHGAQVAEMVLEYLDARAA